MAYVETRCYGAADVLARLVRGDALSFAVYLEYENLAAPGDPVVEPADATDRDVGLDYYTGLASPRDYVRVPVDLVTTLATTDAAKYVANIATILAVAAGSAGENGLAFSESVNSAVYGATLVAVPDTVNASQDIVFARAYWASAPLPKAVGRNFAFRWPITFY